MDAYRDELIASLLHEAYNEADRHYCKFSADADAQLRELITAGVDRMSVAERHNGSRVAEAQHNIRILCEDICKRTRRDRHVIVENRTFSSARLSICPLWPFC